MSVPGPSLPSLAANDFGPAQLHVAEAVLNGKVFAILHRNDPARGIVPNLSFAPDDDYLYLIVHGGDEVTRFQDQPTNASYEIPAAVIAELLRHEYGGKLIGLPVRVCACYGTMLRPTDRESAVQALAKELPQTVFEGYHAVVALCVTPPHIRLGPSSRWDPLFGPIVVGPPGGWELVVP